MDTPELDFKVQLKFWLQKSFSKCLFFTDFCSYKLKLKWGLS